MGQKRKKRTRNKRRGIVAVDLFCGIGGLTRGLEKAGITVKYGVDIDPTCAYPYTANNNAEFLLKSVAELSAIGRSILSHVSARAVKSRRKTCNGNR